MKINKLVLFASSAALVLALAGCSDDDDNEVPVSPTPPVTAVPDSAGVSSVAFISFILSLSGSDESSEPLTIKDAFSVPAEDGAEPTPLT